MVLAALPTVLWVQSEINSSGEVLGYSTVYEVDDKTDHLITSYEYFGIEDVFQDDNKPENEAEIYLSPTPITVTSPTPTPQNIAVVASQERNVAPAIAPRVYTPPEEINTMIEKYAAEYGADPLMMKKIAKCESGYNPAAISPSGAYHGIYQFVSSTWVSNRNAMGLDPDPDLRRDAQESIRTAAFKMGRDGYSAWPTCSRI